MKNRNLNIPVKTGATVTVVGDIHEHPDQFFEMIDRVKPSKKNIFVSVGDVYDKGYGTSTANKILAEMKKLSENGVGFMVKGNHELKRLKRTSKKDFDEYLHWVNKLPLALSFSFNNGKRLTVVHGGILPKHNWNDLVGNTDIVYVRKVDEYGNYIKLKWVKDDDGTKHLEYAKPGVYWHEKYDGRFGYIASGHEPQKDGEPKWFEHSCNLDTACYDTGVLCAQVFNERGRGELIKIHGKACSTYPVY